MPISTKHVSVFYCTVVEWGGGLNIGRSQGPFGHCLPLSRVFEVRGTSYGDCFPLYAAMYSHYIVYRLQQHFFLSLLPIFISFICCWSLSKQDLHRFLRIQIVILFLHLLSLEPQTWKKWMEPDFTDCVPPYISDSLGKDIKIRMTAPDPAHLKQVCILRVLLKPAKRLCEYDLKHVKDNCVQQAFTKHLQSLQVCCII